MRTPLHEQFPRLVFHSTGEVAGKSFSWVDLVGRRGGAMDKADIAALLALGAACFIAVGDVMHQRTAHEVTGDGVGHLELFRTLLRDRTWWLGSLVAAVGFGLQAAALGFGSVLLVQALLVTSLLFALPINARLSRTRVSRFQWTWAALLAGSVIVIVTVGNPTEGVSRASFETWSLVLVVLGPAIAACVIGAKVFAGPVSAVLLALVSGALWGLFAVLTKGVVDRLDFGSVQGVLSLLADARAVRMGVGGDRRDGLATVVFPGRRADGITADHDRHRARRRLDPRRGGPRRVTATGRGGQRRAGRGRRGHGRRHGGAGARGGHRGRRRRTRSSGR